MLNGIADFVILVLRHSVTVGAEIVEYRVKMEISTNCEIR